MCPKVVYSKSTTNLTNGIEFEPISLQFEAVDLHHAGSHTLRLIDLVFQGSAFKSSALQMPIHHFGFCILGSTNNINTLHVPVLCACAWCITGPSYGENRQKPAKMG